MRKSVITGQFRRDVARLRRQGKDMTRLKAIMMAVLRGEELPRDRRDHKLVGPWRGRRECHVAPDWLLIYLLRSEDVVFERTGSHRDLFE